MKIAEKIAAKAKDNFDQPGVTIAFLGDSVTQGCFELYRIDQERFETVFDKNSTYHSYLAEILSVLYPTVPINMINAGVSGGSAEHGLKRLERDVITHNPDLTVVCFGLNDCGHYEDGLKTYSDSLEQIFTKLEEAGSEIIFMTPNMMATYVSFRLEDAKFRLIAEKTAERQNEGIFEMYLNEAKAICARHNIKVCDCYAKWKMLYDNGVDVTELLANQINHPIREMNWLFAMSLVETMMS